MTKQELFELIKEKQSFLCVGLDSNIDLIPISLKDYADPVFEFNKRIIDATLPYTVSYKINTAFYESQGAKGWQTLEKTIAYLNKLPEKVFTIADAKRADIGNTSKQYAKAFFEKMDFDAVTVAPYMGSDSVKPFLDYENKWVILLALTSNEGAFDFQLRKESKPFLYKTVLSKSQEWADSEKMMYVIGATKASHFSDIRKQAPEHFFLVPGVGAQGGDLKAIAKYGMNSQCGLLVNSSRAIIFADGGPNFDRFAAREAKNLQQQMSQLL